MTAVEHTRAPRRAPWADARFLLGILLIVASVLGVWFVVSAARQTDAMLAASRTIVAGQIVSADDVRVVEVALGQAGTTYLADGALEPGVVATRTVARGELIPRTAVGDASASRTTSVVVRSAADVPAVVGPGSVVEVWAAPLVERGLYDPPRILVADATVARVERDESMMGGGAASVELSIPRADVATVLAAIADQSAVSVVPSAGSSR